jgi:hypothetical protein
VRRAATGGVAVALPPVVVSAAPAGIRHDNRPENLELWVSTRTGQRVDDLLRFVVEQYPARLAEIFAEAKT